MLTPWDDYPIHQIPAPIVQAAGSEPGRYERYWFSWFDRAQSVYAGFGLGIYPNTGVIDAAFSVADAQGQEALFACGRADPMRQTLQAGPIRLDVVEPMRTLRIRVDETDGLGLDLTWHARTPVALEPRAQRAQGGVQITDVTRTVQFGHCSGHMTAFGTRHDMDPAHWLGTRDRSWGMRSIAAAGADPAMRPKSAYFCWAILQFDDFCAVVNLNEEADGRPLVRSATWLPVIGPDAPVLGDGLGVCHTGLIDLDIGYQPGSRHPAGAKLVLGPRGGIALDARLEPRYRFQMKGLGYFHPRRAHGGWHPDEPVRRESWRHDSLDPLAGENIHAQTIVTARCADGRVGLGALEHLVIGPYEPAGIPASGPAA
ncbi:MAG: hypothetical protein R3E48_03135 [Burkholderiaceae bacterium]